MKQEKMNILWMNADSITAEEMLFKYVVNAPRQGWWEDVLVIIWGSSANLVAADPKFQDLVREGIEEGVRFSACKSCADNLGASETLRTLGVEVVYWGERLSNLLKAEEKLITI
ncbi:MAG: DsrE family protein [Candidatus Marinimicrobia bacterium]|nr:DsrE family protein [Candidatus Neomarinimicrobiota bacterium]MCF7850038.1 DsrE family protein [Candidatus Neomarinimicrobiota bacterium]MCF7905434.1 DsrE family protein [Candidatus Neomarinimicrobiota bacterium]